MAIKCCKHCGDTFNTNSQEKIRAGGFINECPQCVDDRGGDDSEPKFLGVLAGDGKMSDITILKFKDEASRDLYSRSWRNNAGYNKGKSCQLGAHLTSMNGMKFEQVAEHRGNGNHKGKAN